MHSIYRDCKMIHSTLDGLKSAYVVDNTKMIELDEICLNHKQLLGVTCAQLDELTEIASKVKGLKEQIATKVFSMRSQL